MLTNLCLNLAGEVEPSPRCYFSIKNDKNSRKSKKIFIRRSYFSL